LCGWRSSGVVVRAATIWWLEPPSSWGCDWVSEPFASLGEAKMAGRAHLALVERAWS